MLNALALKLYNLGVSFELQGLMLFHECECAYFVSFWLGRERSGLDEIFARETLVIGWYLEFLASGQSVLFLYVSLDPDRMIWLHIVASPGSLVSCEMVSDPRPRLDRDVPVLLETFASLCFQEIVAQVRHDGSIHPDVPRLSKC